MICWCRSSNGAPCRLLFVAHREEILKQSLYIFRAVLKDANFGELFVGGYNPESIDHLFLSIQTFNSQDFSCKTAPDFYDYIVVDEFHHAAAPTYQKLLQHYRPKILLGLTATPERMDGKSILPYFGDRIAAEIRLPEAIDRKLLCPFQYFGVTDTVDLDSLRWTQGGYDKSELERVYAFSGAVAQRRAELAAASVMKCVTDIDEVKGLGFCVSVEHANFMAEQFNRRGIPSISLTGKSSDEERNAAKHRLVSGEVRFIFVVDIYNEGVDIPEVNTVPFLRPTESLTAFLQQLGRGLRLAEDKECLTVLDFPRAVYKYASISRLCVRAGVREDFREPLEELSTKAFAKFAVVDSRRWISFLLDILPRLDNVDFSALPDVQKRMLQMLYVTIWGKTAPDWNDDEVQDNLYALSDSTVLLGELMDLLRYRFEQIDFLDAPVDLGFDCPLDLHCTYSRDQLLAALDFMKPHTVREGVKWLPDKQLDVFMVTLNKADKDYSPTTMYNDYSINESLFHWQSQSTTAEHSPTGQRYIHHRERGSRVLLFVREFKTDRLTGGAEAYTFLGTAEYVSHEGSRPMNITWRLDRPIPAKFLKKTNKLVVG